MSYGLGEKIVKLRWLILILTVVFVSLAALGIPNLKFKSDYRIFFSDKNPQFNAFEAFLDIYGEQDNILIALAPKDGNVFTRKTLAIIEDFTEKAWQTPFSSRVDSITNFQHTYAKKDDLIVTSLAENSNELLDDQIAHIRSIALNEPLLVNRLVSDKGHVTAVNITMNLPEDSGTEEANAVAYVRGLVADLQEKHSDIEVYISGQTILNISFIESAMKDSMTLIPAMFLFIIIVIIILLRSFFAMVGTILVVAFSVIVAAGVSGFTGILQSSVTAMVPIIILTLGVADSVHLLITFLHQLSEGKSRHASVIEALSINMQPIFLTSITTIIGFLSLNFNESPPFHDMGNMVAIGVFAAYFLSAFSLPAFLAVIPFKKPKRFKQETAFIHNIYKFVEKNKTALFAVTTILTLFLAYSIEKIEFNDLFAEYFDESVRFRVDNDFICDNLTGVMALHYSIESGSPGGIYSPEYLNQLEIITAWFSKQKYAVHVDSVSDIIKRINKTLHADNQKYYKIPDNKKQAAQYMLLYELSLPYGLDLNNLINVDKSSSRLTVILDNINSKDIIALNETAQKWAKINTPALKLGEAVGPSIMFAHISERNLISMINGIILALFLISTAIFIALKNIKLGLLSFIPNLVPIVMAFGTWALIVTDLDMSGSCVAVIVLGIIVDNTVHFLSKYMRAIKEKHCSTKKAILYSYTMVGKALITTALILISGFLILTLSTFHPNRVMGLLTSIALSFGILVTFFMFPPILLLFDKQNNQVSSE